jgi:hypothetical protein
MLSHVRSTPSPDPTKTYGDKDFGPAPGVAHVTGRDSSYALFRAMAGGIRSWAAGRGSKR